MLHHHFPWPLLDRDLDAPWMMFVDGENLAIRGKRVASKAGLTLMEGPFYRPDVFLWLPMPTHAGVFKELAGQTGRVLRAPVQSHYYTSVVADDKDLQDVSRQARDAGFKPHVFKKPSKTQKSKGVDISLARDLLVNGFEGGFDYAVLIAGDQDYLPLVQELQRRRLAVYVTFFDDGLGPRLRTEADFFFPLDDVFLAAWDEYLYPRVGQYAVPTESGRILVNLHMTRSDPDPRWYHGEEADHVRLVLGDQSWRITPGSVFDREMDPEQVESFVRTLVKDAAPREADFVREALGM